MVDIEINRSAIEALVNTQEARKMHQVALMVERQARANAPKGETGDLEASIGRVIHQGGRNKILSIEVGSDLDYAATVEGGADEHIVRPVNGKVLVFPGKGGKIIYRPRATIPARTGVHFLQRALDTVFNRL